MCAESFITGYIDYGKRKNNKGGPDDHHFMGLHI